MRLAKAISDAGVCSRREAERLINEGVVKVDGALITSPATIVSDDNCIEVNGKKLEKKVSPRLWVYYKPIGLLTTHKDTHDRATVFDNLLGLPRVISIGRLDLNSEGLLLLTNNGELARTLELPATKLERIYKVRALGHPGKLLKLDITKPLIIEGVTYNPQAIKLTKTNGANSWFEVTLAEGKNREIRRIFDHFGLRVNRLIRVSYGPFVLGNLKPGECKEEKPAAFLNFLTQP